MIGAYYLLKEVCFRGYLQKSWSNLPGFQSELSQAHGPVISIISMLTQLAAAVYILSSAGSVLLDSRFFKFVVLFLYFIC